MLGKHQRIPRKAFKPLLESRLYRNSPHFSLKMAQSSHFSAAVSVSKKVAKRAVDRNRLRRRAYAVIKELLPLSHHQYFLIARVGAPELEYSYLKSELVSLFKKS